jgi:hypothetical protein
MKPLFANQLIIKVFAILMVDFDGSNPLTSPRTSGYQDVTPLAGAWIETRFGMT